MQYWNIKHTENMQSGSDCKNALTATTPRVWLKVFCLWMDGMDGKTQCYCVTWRRKVSGCEKSLQRPRSLGNSIWVFHTFSTRSLSYVEDEKRAKESVGSKVLHNHFSTLQAFINFTMGIILLELQQYNNYSWSL